MAAPMGNLTFFNLLSGDITSYTTLRDFDTLFNEAPLLEHLVLSGDTDIQRREFGDGIHAPYLVGLVLSGGPSLLAHYLDAPRLTTLNLEYFSLSSFLDSLVAWTEPPFPEVTDLRLQPDIWTTKEGLPLELMIIVEQMPNVEHFHMDVTMSNNASLDYKPMLDVIRHRWLRLRSFTTEGMGSCDIFDFAHSRQGMAFAEFYFGPEFVARMTRDYPETWKRVRALGIEVKVCSSYRNDKWYMCDEEWARKHEAKVFSNKADL